MTSTPPQKNLDDIVLDIDYKLYLLMQDIANIKNSINNLKEYNDTLKTRLTQRYGFLKQVLLYKAKDKLEKGDKNDYISMLTILYKLTDTQIKQMVDPSIDNSPVWMIAEAVLAETDAKIRNGWIDMFLFVYKVHPGNFFEVFS